MPVFGRQLFPDGPTRAAETNRTEPNRGALSSAGCSWPDGAGDARRGRGKREREGRRKRWACGSRVGANGRAASGRRSDEGEWRQERSRARPTVLRVIRRLLTCIGRGGKEAALPLPLSGEIHTSSPPGPRLRGCSVVRQGEESGDAGAASAGEAHSRLPGCDGSRSACRSRSVCPSPSSHRLWVEFDGLDSFHRTVHHQHTVTSLPARDGMRCIRLPSPDSQSACALFARLQLDVVWPADEGEQAKLGTQLRDEVAAYLSLPPASVTVLRVFEGSFNADLCIADEQPECHPNETSMVWLRSLQDSLGGLVSGKELHATVDGAPLTLLPKLQQCKLTYVALVDPNGVGPPEVPLASPTLSASHSDSSLASASPAAGGQPLQSPAATLEHPLEKMWAKIEALTTTVATSSGKIEQLEATVAASSGKIEQLKATVGQLQDEVKILHLKHTNANLLIQLAEAWQILKDMLAARLKAYSWTKAELNHLAFYIGECFAKELQAVELPLSLLNLLPLLSGTPAPALGAAGLIASSSGPSKPSTLDPQYVKQGAAHLRAVLKTLNIKESAFLLCARVNGVRNDFVSHDPRANGDKAQKEAMLSEAIATLSAVTPELSDEMFGDGGSTGALAILCTRIKSNLPA